MFADDTKVLKTINSADDQHTLQGDLDLGLLRFQADKYKLMHLGKTVEQEYAYNLNVRRRRKGHWG